MKYCVVFWFLVARANPFEGRVVSRASSTRGELLNDAIDGGNNNKTRTDGYIAHHTGLRYQESFYDANSLLGGNEDEEERVAPHLRYLISHNHEPSVLLPDSDSILDDSILTTGDLLQDDTAHRKLSLTTSTIGNFQALDCNANLASVSCSNTVTLPSGSNPLEIPCGQCYTFDASLGRSVTIAGGINVKGKLRFAPDVQVEITTPYVIVQGELEITTAHTMISPEMESVKFILTGTSNVLFKPTDSPNAGACTQQPNGVCNLGTKPFVVAGGRLNINAFPAGGCKTHTPILGKVLKHPEHDPLSFESIRTLPESCPISGTTDYVQYDLEGGNLGNWTGHLGAVTMFKDRGLRIGARKATWQGPLLDLTPMMPHLCLVPNQKYLLTARIKLDKADGSDHGLPTTCKYGQNGSQWFDHCPRIVSKVGKATGGDIAKTKVHMIRTVAPNYGEWVVLSGEATWDEEELASDSTYFLLYIDEPEPGVDISLDFFSLSLPGAKSYSDPNDLCGELILNGDAEANGFNPYPVDKSDWHDRVMILEEDDGNKYFHLGARSGASSTIVFPINPSCMDVGVTYTVNGKFRIHSDLAEDYYIYLRAQRPDGSWFSRSIVDCPGHSFSDGWVACSGKFIVDAELASSVQVKWQHRFHNWNGGSYPVDYDDISIEHASGYVEKLKVSADDVSCWGSNSEVHIASSTYYNFNNEAPNGVITTMGMKENSSGGIIEISLNEPPSIPIISQDESAESMTYVALLNRNVKIQGGDSDAKKGGYLQVLHTLDQFQTLVGVEFSRMGQLGNVDRFPLQIVWSGSVPGTTIAMNSFRDNNFRCISIEGTSNITISQNVANRNRGHCMYIGSLATHNTISNNFVSETLSVSWNDRIESEDDYNAAGYKLAYQPNDCDDNVAIGNSHHGFKLATPDRARLENGQTVRETIYKDPATNKIVDVLYPNPRKYQIGSFSNNVANSNGDSGFQIYYGEQEEWNIFESLVAIKNRYRGLYMDQSFRGLITSSLFAENALYNVDIQWSDEIQIVDTNIRGVSAETKKLVQSPYFNKPCVSSGFGSSDGYRMQTAVHRWDRIVDRWVNNGQEWSSQRYYGTNTGVALQNVHFSHFDHSDECISSVPITFNTDSMRDGHWDYASSFKNVTFDGSNIMNAGLAWDKGVKDIVITDIDGRSDPAGKASAASSFVSNTDYLKGFAGGSCKEYFDGIAYCSDTCLRTVTLRVDQSETSAINLRVTRRSDGSQVTGLGIYLYDADPILSAYESNERQFSVSLPHGEYTVEFVDGDQTVWPRHVYEIWEGVPSCENYVMSTDVTIVEPPLNTDECTELIRNGDMTLGVTYWQHRGSRNDGNNLLQVVEGGGSLGSNAIGLFKRNWEYSGIGQNLDTRCFHENSGSYFEIVVWFKLEKDKIPYICDRFSSDWKVRCPTITLKTVHYDDPMKEVLDWDYDNNMAEVVVPNDSQSFNMIHGVIKIDEKYSKVNRAWIYAEMFDKPLDLIFDQFSISKLEAACNVEFIRNGDFGLGYSSFWKPYSSRSKFRIVSIGDGYAMEVYEKPNKWDAVYQDLYIDKSCLAHKDRFKVMGKFKLIKKADGQEVKCNLAATDTIYECSALALKAYSSSGDPFRRVADTVALASDAYDGWSLMAGVFTMNDIRFVDHTRMWIRMEGTHVDVSVIYDDISVTPIPKSCDNLILNHDFEDGSASFWVPQARDRINVSLVSPGVQQSQYALLLQHTTSNRGYTFDQYLDTRCLVEGDNLIIEAQFKLLDKADLSSGLSCDPSSRNTNSADHCPTIRLTGRNCKEGNIDAVLWNQQPFAVWHSDGFNFYSNSFSVSANLASCEESYIRLAHSLPDGVALVVDNVKFTERKTAAPTLSPTFSPTTTLTPAPTANPTISTDAPTTSIVVSCPVIGSSFTLDQGSFMFERSSANVLCMLMKTISRGGDDITVPIARSYDTYDWEAAAGSFASSLFSQGNVLCYNQGCQLDLPELDVNEHYILISYSHSRTNRDEYARFLETATFGVTENELSSLEESSPGTDTLTNIAIWLSNQMDLSIVPATSHREFWRGRANPRAPVATAIGTPDHPCEISSRWRKYTFVRNDFRWFMPKKLRIIGSGPFTLILDGIVRTAVENMWIVDSGYADYKFNPNFDYIVCRDPEEFVNGRLWITLEDGTCRGTQNPPVNLSGITELVSYQVELPNFLDPVDLAFSKTELFILNTSVESAICSAIPAIPEFGDDPIFGRLPDGSWLQFDARLELEQNTLKNPLIDGGKVKHLASGKETLCSNVPRNFLNEETCIISSNACSSTISSSDLEILLNDNTIVQLTNLTGRYVYAIDGLNVIEKTDSTAFAWKLPHPCTEGLRSRWEKLDSTSFECYPTNLDPQTNETLYSLLSTSNDKNPFVRDIYFPAGGHCNFAADYDPEIVINVDGQCWRRIHHDKWSVFDMTYWVEKHPGGAFHIKKWFENCDTSGNCSYNGSILIFPNDHPVNPHTMDRWGNNYHKFTYVGRRGDHLKIRDLPNELRTEALTSFYDQEVNGVSGGILVCGSPGEVSNEKQYGFYFDVDNSYQTGYWGAGDNRRHSWIMLSLSAQDQLRQRVAWAFAQILVVVAGAIDNESANSEWFLSYYDIFIRNAFGNYRDILREVSYSPLMAENLSYLRSRSSAYVWERFHIKAQADENFAREIMQLFSMGIVKLNMDGSPKLDSEGNVQLAYTNDDIMSLSRVWTGFDFQPRRGNIEGVFNRIDPMRIDANWRDRFPKSDTTGGYIGDMFYPLCEDLPNHTFLKKGAKYRFLGSSTQPELMSDPAELASDVTTKRIALDSNSALKAILCNARTDGQCQYKNTVMLASNIQCTGIECSLDTLRVIKVGENSFYEYVHPPCVSQVFYDNAKTISQRYREDPTMCTNSELPVAAEACCSFGSSQAIRVSMFDGERLKLSSARSRCESVGLQLCDFYRVDGNRHKNSMFFWTNDDCLIYAKIAPNGMVTVVHNPSHATNIVPHLRDDNENWFKVFWSSNKYPMAENNCDDRCQVLPGNSCLCKTKVVKSSVFSKSPSSMDEMLRKLSIGAANPEMYGSGVYSESYDPLTGITTYIRGTSFDQSTIFHYTDDKGRSIFLKNSRETVQLYGINGHHTGYSFRNAPQFMSFIPAETTERDAQYEVEATLDHYFYHDNVAPFISYRLIQRLITSNPSPRYVTEVSHAFKSGRYVLGDREYGKGKYGDLAATFAAIYLDREARNVLLDVDPTTGSLREPILKLMAVMRSMNFSSSFPVTRLSNLKRDIGQEAYEFESVFSFFLPEFKPQGRVGDATLVSPEGTLLDMPKIVGILNGLFSLAKYGLSDCDSGFGAEWCTERLYRPSKFGLLEYNRTSLDAEFFFETFEGQSLVGGFDNQWVGRYHRQINGGISINDPLHNHNHVLHLLSGGEPMYSPRAKYISAGTVVKFQYLALGERFGGCIGYNDNENLNSQNWMYCDWAGGAQFTMTSNNNWITCQFEIPQTVETFRVVLQDRRSTGDAYFDNIQVSSGFGNTCTGVVLDDVTSPGGSRRSEMIVDQLATLLTAGRLNARSRAIIRDAYDHAGGPNDGLRMAQQLIFTTPEFHSTNIVKPKDIPREDVSFPAPSGKPYRAVVYVMFSGGCDSYNMLMPHTCTKGKDLYEEYRNVRQQVALPKSNILPVDVQDQICERFGIHPDLPEVKRLYDNGDLLFFANTGVMSQPVDKTNYNILTETQLFAHNHMQEESKRVDPYKTSSGTGVLGRMSDVLVKQGHNVGSFSVDRYSVALVGHPGISTSPMIVNRNGVPSIFVDDVKDMIGLLHNATESHSGFFGETWSESLMDSLGINKLLSTKLNDVVASVQFPNTYFGSQLNTVTRLMATREARGVDTDTFYVEIGGYDTHADVEMHLSNRFKEVNDGIEAFVSELQNMGLWDNVALIQVSDFARTLNPNSGDGTDHAWGGNYMLLGGSVKGGQILGEYPHDLTDDGPLTLGRGRMIPTTPWDAVFHGIATWLGVPESEMTNVVPNIQNFESSLLFSDNDMFNGPPRSDVTPSRHLLRGRVPAATDTTTAKP